MKLTIHATTESFRQLEPEWDDLLRRSYTNRVFSTYEWQYTWWQAYEAGEQMIVACRDDDERLIGLAPWFIEQRPDERVVRSIGCVDVTDYVDVIVDRDYVQPVAALLAAFLTEERGRFDRINLCNIPEQSPTLVHFPPALQACGFETETELQEVCPVIHLPGAWETYLESLDKKNRHELRRKLRRASGEGEAVDWYFVGAQHDLNAELDKFFDLMAASQPAKAEFLSNPRNAAFMRAMTQVMAERGWLQLSFLTVEGTPAAAYFNFDYGDGIQVYNSGLAHARFSHLSAGIVLLAHNIEHAITLGRRDFDFLRGNEEYKYRLGAVDTKILKLKAS